MTGTLRERVAAVHLGKDSGAAIVEFVLLVVIILCR